MKVHSALVINKETKKDAYSYPRLLISKDGELVVLFSKEGVGTIVHTTSLLTTDGQVADYCKNWCMEDFVPLNGYVVLKEELEANLENEHGIHNLFVINNKLYRRIGSTETNPDGELYKWDDTNGVWEKTYSPIDL